LGRGLRKPYGYWLFLDLQSLGYEPVKQTMWRAKAGRGSLTTTGSEQMVRKASKNVKF